MPDDRSSTLRQADQARDDFAKISEDLDFIKVQLARLPTRNDVWRAAMLGMLGGAVAAVTLIEAFSRACRQAMQTFWSLTVIASLFAIVLILTHERSDQPTSRARVVAAVTLIEAFSRACS